MNFTTVLLVVTGAVVLLIAIRWGYQASRQRGRTEERSEGQERVIENVDKANKAVRSLSDPDRRRKLHEKYGSK